MKLSDVKNMTNTQLLETYTAQCYSDKMSRKAIKEQRWVLEEIAKRIGDVDDTDIDNIMGI